MLVQHRDPAQPLSDDRNPAKVAARLGGKRGAFTVKPPSAQSEVGSQEPQAPPKQAESNDQNRGLVPEGVTENEQSQSAAQEPEAQVEKGKTQKKFRRLLEQKAAASAENAQLKAELDAVKAQVAGMQRQQPNTPSPQNQPRRMPEFSTAFPENGTIDEQMVWRAEKAGHDAAQRVFAEQLPAQLGESFGKFAQVISPALEHSLSQIVDQQWEAMRPKLESMGVSVADARALVEEEVTKYPGLGIEEATGRVLFGRNFSAHWQEEPVEAPAAPPPARPSGPARSVAGRFQAPAPQGGDPVEQARDLRKSGNKFASEAVMAKYVSALARGRK